MLLLAAITTRGWSKSWPSSGGKGSEADGSLVTYQSRLRGSTSGVPSPTGKWQVSNAGGQEPRWRRDGKELFYISPDGKMMSVEVKSGTGFGGGRPESLFQSHRRQPVSALDLFSYDVSEDGRRFLVATKLDAATVATLSVTLNWASELEK